MNKKILVLRAILLAGFLIFISFVAYMHQSIGGGSTGAPSIHALCPFGGLESLYALVTAGTFIEKIFSAALALLVITIVLAIILRRSFCGLICPLGALQEFLGWLGAKLHLPKITVPDKLDRLLRLLKYIVLIVVVAAAWVTAGLWMSPYDPWAAYAHLFAGISTVISEYPIGFAILVVTIIGSFFIKRIFCKYLCPMGAFLGLVSMISPNVITRDNESCVHCRKCSKSCPMDIDVSEQQRIKSLECINCQICVLSCPKKGVLENHISKFKVKPLWIIVLSLMIFFGGIGIARLTGFYQEKPEAVKAGEVIKAEDIKGYMTLQEVSDGLQMPLDELYKKLEIDKKVPADTKMKDIQNIVPDFDVEAAREKLKE